MTNSEAERATRARVGVFVDADSVDAAALAGVIVHSSARGKVVCRIAVARRSTSRRRQAYLRGLGFDLQLSEVADDRLIALLVKVAPLIDVITLCAGDSDFVPVCELLVAAAKKRLVVVSRAASASRRLLSLATEVVLIETPTLQAAKGGSRCAI